MADGYFCASLQTEGHNNNNNNDTKKGIQTLVTQVSEACSAAGSMWCSGDDAFVNLEISPQTQNIRHTLRRQCGRLCSGTSPAK